jgi:hypothetical protein
MLLAYDPATVLLGISPKELKNYIHTKICVYLFVEGLLIAKTWDQSKYSSVDERINYAHRK